MPYIRTSKTRARYSRQDVAKLHHDIKRDMRERHGVHNAHIVQPGVDLERLKKDVDSSGNEVREKLSAQREMGQKRMNQKKNDAMPGKIARAEKFTKRKMREKQQ